MSRIISPELNKKLRIEYKLRFFTLLFFLISIAILINIALVASSYVLLYMYEKTYTEPVSPKKIEEISMNEEFTKKVSQVHALGQKVIFDTKITLRGIAYTRDSLIEFENKIKQDTSFKDFSIPIDAFTKQKDISFSVTFTYHEN